jgi:hypothetical protein
MKYASKVCSEPMILLTARRWSSRDNPFIIIIIIIIKSMPKEERVNIFTNYNLRINSLLNLQTLIFVSAAVVDILVAGAISQYYRTK